MPDLERDSGGGTSGNGQRLSAEASRDKEGLSSGTAFSSPDTAASAVQESRPRKGGRGGQEWRGR